MLILGSMPIGNKKDISIRMIELINSSDLIIVETVFKFLKQVELLNLKYNGKVIEWNTVFVHDSRFEYIKNQNISIIKDYLSKNLNVLFISDEGQACLNDPGYTIVDLTSDIEYNIEIIPGPSVITTAASYGAVNNNGASDFIYWVNIRQNKEERIDYLTKIKELPIMIVFTSMYPNLINLDVLQDILDTLGNRNITLCMSLTTSKQEVLNFKIKQLIEKIKLDDEFMCGIGNNYKPLTVVIGTPESAM
jgi:16S rRNA (cytidine1402-2'-O)-methyltransferase